MSQALARVVQPREGRRIQMNDDRRPDGSEEDRATGAAGPAITTRDDALTSTFTDISGRPAFVIAAVDHPDAWLAVTPEVVVDTDELR